VEHYAVACNGYYGIFRRFNKDNLLLAEGMR
jgi:hypothetical protein